MMIPVMKKQPMGLAASQTLKPTPLPNQIGMPPKPVNMLNTAGVGKPVAFNGLAAKAAPAVNMPQHAGVAAGTAQMVKNNAVTGQPASVNPTPVQQAAQNTAGYFNQNFGGSDKYAADQNKRYADAYAANDTALMGKLIADSQRVGYAINMPGTPVLSYNDAVAQANQQLEPLYQQDVATTKAEGWQNHLNADELGTSHGGSHSGLAADLQNKVNINTENAIKDLAAKKSAQAAQIAQGLVQRSEDNAYRDKTFNYQVGRDKVADANYKEETAYNHDRDKTADERNTRLDNWNAANVVSQMTGKVIHPQDDLTGLFRQADDPNTPYTLAGQQNKDQHTVTMAELTGFMPDGTPTNAKQQQDLQNLWTVAANTGTIPDKLADFYGIKRGTKTQAAYQFAKGLAIDWYNSQTSRMNAQNSQDQTDLEYIKYDDAQSQPTPGKTISGATAGDMLSSSLRKIIGVDPATGETKYGTITDPDTREKLFVDAWNASGVAPGQDTIEMLTKAGYTAAEIAKYKKNPKYAAAFQ
jgi:hypothetical protein